jgi:predicted Rossmann fold nucleotide-binding protein DprA/Smf involved in DNA uptake
MAVTTDDRLVAILLASPFGSAAGENLPPPLGPVGWHRLTSALAHRDLRPGNLLAMTEREVDNLLSEGGFASDRGVRLRRAAPVAMELEQLADRGIWVMADVDDDYPRRLHDRLGTGAPPILFGAGERSLVDRGGLAIVGSRDAGDAALAFASSLAGDAARAGVCVISGAARGVDQVAMRGAVDASGQVIGILADGLARRLREPELRDQLLAGRVVLISPYIPSAGFSVRTAMGRNKLIYGLADAAVIVTSAMGEGGTWSGAVEALKAGDPAVFLAEHVTDPARADLLGRGAREVPTDGGNLPESILAAAREAPSPRPIPQLRMFDERG